MTEEKGFTMGELSDKYLPMEEKCAYYRGQFIHACTKLEMRFDEMLSYYFSSDNKEKATELFYVVFATEKISLHHKYNILSFIMHKHFKEFYDKQTIKIEKKDRKKDEPKEITLDKKVNDIIELRNKFAHRQLIKTAGEILEFDGKNINLNTHKGKHGKYEKQDLELNDSIIQSYVDEITMLEVIFLELRDLIMKKKK